MKVDSRASTNTSTKKRPLINLKSTGYVAVAGMGLSGLSGFTKNEFLRKNHKVFAGISFLAVFAHLYVIFGGHKRKKVT